MLNVWGASAASRNATVTLSAGETVTIGPWCLVEGVEEGEMGRT